MFFLHQIRGTSPGGEGGVMTLYLLVLLAVFAGSQWVELRGSSADVVHLCMFGLQAS